MTTWDYVRAKLDQGASLDLAVLVAALDDDQRAEVARALPGHLKEAAAARDWGWWNSNRGRAAAFHVAGAGCISGAAAAATWLSRRDLDTDRDDTRHPQHIAMAVAHRPPSWRADVARRIARRLRVADQSSWWGDAARWRIADRLARDAGEGLPEDDAYVVGYARWTDPRTDLKDDPYLDVLLPRLFEVEAVGRVLGGGSAAGAENVWFRPLLDLTEAGAVKRAVLIDGCARRFLRGGRIQDLRWYANLYGALAPSLAEAAAHTRDLVRVLPSAPGPIAELALTELRRLDDAGELDATSFGEAAEALLFRSEKKLVRATLTWLDRAARERADTALTALSVAFAQESLDLQERAAKIALKHAGKVSAATRDAVRDAAVTLPAEARDRIAAAFGEVTTETTGTTAVALALPASAPPHELAPIASLAELAEAVEVHLRGDLTWMDGERLLAGLVEFAVREPDETRTVLRRIVPVAAPWLMYDQESVSEHPTRWLGEVVRPLVPPTEPDSYPSSSPGRVDDWRAPAAVLQLRVREIATVVGRHPVLLSTPTLSTGHVAPGVLVERLERIEAAGFEPGPLDLDQALLRLPRAIPADVVLRAKALTSPGGRRAAAWLAQGGMADPGVACRLVTVQRPRYGWGSGPREDVDLVLPTIAPPDGVVPDPDGLGRLLTHSKISQAMHAANSFQWWPSLLPSHREVLAAHVLVPMADRTDSRDGQGALLLALAEADGPGGPAIATALALGLSSRRAEERASAVDAFVTFCARGQLPAADLGTAIAVLPQVKLNRVTEALTDAARSGAHADVLKVIVTALPGLLPRRAGLADLIALAAEAVENGARAPLPPEIAGISGSSRVAREVARLVRALT